ncbi:short-chain dehydrogenase/reductase [Ophiocordyceps camponoti-floridani]|uniref:Short-chain dehydrogenase/reductase n=1 Tax=Ophiocordyceps camponoti-floridani TaxID=2030778 RepID=A0A8H4QAZ0_9HYPO|nr:short-chain dehydrogenase/reductase [Ophiocordyceps camponoti-floridani]
MPSCGAGCAFDPKKDIPSLEGKVILVTGANAGLGKQAILDFSQHHPRQIWLGARSADKADEAIKEIRAEVPDAPVKFLQMDLSSLESIKKAVDTFTAESDRLDILMLNAGIMGTAPGLTKEGYETQFGTNHMGHAYLTKLLMPTMMKTFKENSGADVRVVCLSSVAHKQAPKTGIVFDSLKTDANEMGAFERYGQSKIANMLYARQLAKQYPDLTVSAVHPGVVRTNLATRMSGMPAVVRYLSPLANMFFTSVQEGAKNQLWASVSKGVESGEYYEPVGVKGKGTALGRDNELAEKLWEWTEKELDGYEARGRGG